MNTPHPATVPIAPALADLAFASASDSQVSRSLAWSSPGDLGIDLNDPEQRRFGDYELLELIGQGGMGAVYRARQHNLDREVALKFLAAGPWASDEFIARFRREAQAAARMQHPNIVEIYDTGVRDGLYFFSMRLVKGETLSDRLHSKGPMDCRQAATMMRTVAEAIDYAHRLGVLHLDLKPGNVLLGENDDPLVADFGLARRIDDGPQADHENVSGTPSYMAPEQATAKSTGIGPAADIYGLGAILYEMLVGEPPFRGRDVKDTLQHVLHDEPVAPRTRRHDIPADLDAICLKCLAKDPAARYASARQLADDLGRFLAAEQTIARTPPLRERAVRWIRRNQSAAAALLIAAVGVAGIAELGYRAERERAIAEQHRERAEAQRLVAESRLERIAQGNQLMARLFPVNAAELQLLDNPHQAAGKVVEWLDQQAPGKPKEQLEILISFIRALVDAGKGGAAESLVYHITKKGSLSYYREMIGRLIDAHDRDAAFAAVLVAFNLDPASGIFTQTLQRALEQHADDPDLWYLAAVLCRDDGVEDGSCVADRPHERIVELEPDNAAAWIVYHWRAKRDAAAAKEIVLKAANAKRYDDRFGRMLLLNRNASSLAGLPAPELLRDLNTLISPEVAPEFTAGYLRHWDTPIPAYAPLANACKPPTAGGMDPVLRQACHQVGHKMVRSQGGLIGNLIGARIVMRLGRGTPEWDEMIALYKQYRWVSKLPDSSAVNEPDSLEAMSPFVRDVIDAGEFEAFRRRAERHGISRMPPVDFMPDNPAGLLPEEDRAAFLEAQKANPALTVERFR